MNVVKIVLIAFGLFFMLVGMTISISDSPTYAPIVEPLYAGLIYVFYAFVAVIMLGLLWAGVQFALTRRHGN